ncbi:MAG: ParA family protein [Anaerolineales bacterium]|jgi:chromosome partitioning protein
MRRIAIALSKGGVGKTTTAVNLAAGIARAGSTILLIDVDTQGQIARALGENPKAGLADFILGNVDLDEAIHFARPNLGLLAGGRSMSGIKRLIARKDYGGETTLSEVLEPLDDRFDFVLVDSGPGWDVITVNVLFYAYEILAPVSLEVLTLQGLMEFSESVSAIQKYNTNLALKYILPTFYDRRVKKSEEIYNQLKNHFGEFVCQPIRYNVRLSEAPGYGQTIFEYSARSAGAEDYLKLTERIIAE